MDVLEPSEVEFWENAIHLAGQYDNSFSKVGIDHVQLLQLCRYTTVHSLQSRSSSTDRSNWQWRCMCSVSARHHSTSSGNSGPCVARSPLMRVQPSVHAFVTSRLDYGNSLLAEIGDGLIDQLQTVMRVAARLSPPEAQIRSNLGLTYVIYRLALAPHPFKNRLQAGCVLVYKCLHGIAPAYLTEMLVLKSTVPALSRLRSTARGDLLVPRTKTKTIGPEASPLLGPHSGTNCLTYLRDRFPEFTCFQTKIEIISV